MTDRWYWLQIDENIEMFRYTNAISAYWRKEYPEAGMASPYVDYQVSRLWEDILRVMTQLRH